MSKQSGGPRVESSRESTPDDETQCELRYVIRWTNKSGRYDGHLIERMNVSLIISQQERYPHY